MVTAWYCFSFLLGYGSTGGGLVICNENLQKHHWNSKEYGKYEGQRTTKVDMVGGGKKRLEGLECA
jgi:hypothetical protein